MIQDMILNRFKITWRVMKVDSISIYPCIQSALSSM